jgi:hypothetical protein
VEVKGDKGLDGKLVSVHADNSLESLAHEVALAVDGGVFEHARKKGSALSATPR